MKNKKINSKFEWIIITVFIVVVLVAKEMFWLPLLTEEEALDVGVNKYLAFLWIVDGIFNTDDNFTYVVNGKELTDENKIISCRNDITKDKKCIIDDFETSFKNLFAHNIDYQKVTGDDMSSISVSIKDNQYTFKNISLCNEYHMGRLHHLKIESIERNKIVYQVSFEDESIGKVIGRTYEKTFVLVNENRTWKISKAYYHDSCHMDYNIE